MISLILLWLRGAGLVGQTMALGSVAFALIVLRGDAERGVDRFLTVVRFGALVAVVAQIGILATVASALSADGARWAIVDAVGSTVIVAGLARIAAGILVLGAARAVRRMPASRLRGFSLLGSTLLLCVSGALTSHAMGRLDDRAWLVIVTALHQVFVGAWVGGLVCAVIWWMGAAPSADAAWLRRFSVVALVTVAGIAVTGTVLTFVYVATPGAAVGTSYGAMVLTKVVIFIALLAMAALNHRAVH
ncbi:MAG: hypothetical protein DMD81_20715, partial [Candidatus Rokuibacteriota bacterium]